MSLSKVYITNNNKIENHLKETDISGNTVFVIDVHCTFNGIGYMQQQGGVTIYRHLLKKLGDKKAEGKLKVIFFSPLSSDLLVKLKPENYVLKLLPFIELFPDTEQHGIKPEDWTFEKALAEIEKGPFPQFNNAAENLLSGWALAGADKINLHGKKLLVIDDEWKQWEKTYQAILSEMPDFFVFDEPNIRDEFEKLKYGTFNYLQENDDTLSRYDLIISDLYLWESHDTNKWKTEDIIHDITGFKLFEKIREKEPAIPVVFHTTSIKFRIYETLAALGADGQIPKNISCEATNNEKTDTAKLFQEKLEQITSDYSDCWLNEFYRYIKNEEFKGDIKLTPLMTDASKLSEFKTILLHSIVSARGLVKNNIIVNYYDSGSFNPICLSISGIISELGKIPEKFKFLENYAAFNFISNLRDHTSHTSYYDLFEKDDIKLALAPIYISLKKGLAKTQKFSAPHNTLMKDRKLAKHFYKHPALNYLFLYHSDKDVIPPNIEQLFQNRIEVLISMYFDKVWSKYNDQHKNTVKNHFCFLTSRDVNLTNAKVDFSNGSVNVTLN